MRYKFLRFDPCTFEPTRPLRELGLHRTATEFLEGTRRTALTAATLYSGYIPVEALSNSWGDMMPLPWCDDYWVDDGSCIKRVPFSRKEISAYVYALPDIGILDKRFGRGYGRGDGTRQQVQRLAVEVLMFLDRCVEAVAADKTIEAVSWLTGAYDSLLDAVNVVSDDYPDVWQHRKLEESCKPSSAAK